MASAAAVHNAVKRAKNFQEDDNIRTVFSKYDTTGDGAMDLEELYCALKDLGVEDLDKDKHVSKLFERCATESKGGLELSAFENIVNMIREVQYEEANPAPGPEFWPYQHKVNAFYEHWTVTASVASLIIGNFIANIIEVEIDPGVYGVKKFGATWDGLDVTFNIIFLFELLVNMYRYGGPRKAFWSVPWNVFDTIIVTIGMLLVIGGDAIPGDLSRLKLLRAFRVFRLFKRVKSLNRIVTNLIRATPGMLNSLLIMLIVFCVYGVLAVELFHEHGVDHENPHHGQMVTYIDGGLNITFESQTARQVDFGWEYYGTFARSMYTLFQVMTGDSWSEAVVRPLIFGLYVPGTFGTFAVCFFFVSFILITNMVLANVVVAALLDEFVQSADEGSVAADALVEKVLKSLEEKGVAAKEGAPAAAPTAANPFISNRTANAISMAGGTADGKLDAILRVLQKQQDEIAAMKETLDKVVNAKYQA